MGIPTKLGRYMTRVEPLTLLGLRYTLYVKLVLVRRKLTNSGIIKIHKFVHIIVNNELIKLEARVINLHDITKGLG